MSERNELGLMKVFRVWWKRIFPHALRAENARLRYFLELSEKEHKAADIDRADWVNKAHEECRRAERAEQDNARLREQAQNPPTCATCRWCLDRPDHLANAYRTICTHPRAVNANKGAYLMVPWPFGCTLHDPASMRPGKIGESMGLSENIIVTPARTPGADK